MRLTKTLIATAIAAACSAQAHAADWSNTLIGVSSGSKYREPFNNNDVGKMIYTLQHVSGDKYGTNFFNADMLQSDNNDGRAQEVYVVYRRMFDIGKITGTKYQFGPVRGLGATVGFDWNTKNDSGYGSRKRMLVAGPTLMIDVPGFLNVSLLLLNESNDPAAARLPSRYSYTNHAALDLAWGIPLGASGWEFKGYANFIAAKGKDEFGVDTKPETHFFGLMMYDVGKMVGGPAKTFYGGVGYEWWKNKFGNDSSGPAGSGAFAKTPFVRAEYHF